ncbi:uncharacterized protein EI97DRAFT_479338 [Westerdykella ornata]|uniref:DUF4939 domain-containing protein n=1 Tax=Westerdykella ornata TaxID=318751 RepID=A0A6A6JD49_WESOR|nr:uncharacterized protein EI97DRAFT_479338 [Westerdykella ornata]KAF2274103.1 hypothetical protein EI97DRAFT_479338 [Westerdykella ornata]
MSDTSMHTPNQTQGGKSKVAKPDLYFGDCNKLEDWLLQFNLFFKFNDDNIDDDDKASLVASYMRGQAAKWVKLYLIKYMDDKNDDAEITHMFEDYLVFKEKIHQTFAVTNEVSMAERKIQRLR